MVFSVYLGWSRVLWYFVHSVLDPRKRWIYFIDGFYLFISLGFEIIILAISSKLVTIEIVIFLEWNVFRKLNF